jgi:hypothetical protein
VCVYVGGGGVGKYVRAYVRVGGHGRWRVCAPVALLIQHETHRHIAIYDVSVSTIFFDIVS